MVAAVNPGFTRIVLAPSGEAAHTPVPATSKRGLGREVWAALLRVRTRPECPEGNVRDAVSDSSKE